MNNELIFILKTMKNKESIKYFLSSLTLDEKETISHLMGYVSEEVRELWESYF
ncbi:hypothetical protein P4679_26835 [Priestia megaterium]|uniref:hypothetical protein n=1 Tax=Priestia megaterium TaxID=1404 RepID=UPI002E1C6A5A|nr:hypothetical protein [Priestia megaterium]